jgi:hypothetical protein
MRRPSTTPRSRQVRGPAAAIDHAGLDKELRVDAAVLGTAVDRRLFEITELRERVEPAAREPGTGDLMLLARDYAPLPDRLRSLVAGWQQTPARSPPRAIGRMPKVHLETAVAQFGGTIALVTGEVNAALRQAATRQRGQWCGQCGGQCGRGSEERGRRARRARRAQGLVVGPAGGR